MTLCRGDGGVVMMISKIQNIKLHKLPGNKIFHPNIFQVSKDCVFLLIYVYVEKVATQLFIPCIAPCQQCSSRQADILAAKESTNIEW